jgi:DNA-binding winged helix-turn-helix (wHTH) protein
VLRFDDFELDVPTRRLLAAGTEVHLSPKAFDLLVLLVEHRARAMSKAELQTKLWPSTFVLETNLAGLVAEIRRGLQDSPETPRYIRTMSRFGYWFVGDVREAEAPADEGPVRCWLLWESRQVELKDGDNIVGRAADATVWIDATGVSRHHARIRLNGLEATVEDLGSKNGTYLHGLRVTSPQPLADGDQIRLGSMVMTFRIPPPGEPTETVQG